MNSVGSPATVSTGGESNGGIAATSSGFAIVYTSYPEGQAKAAFWDSTLSSSTALPLLGYNPAVGAGPNGFAIAVTMPNGPPQVSIYGVTGTKLCGPTPLGGGANSPSGIAASAKGYLVVDAGARVEEVLSDCSTGQSFPIDTNPGSAGNQRIAGGSSGFGVVWTNAGVPKLRTFGPDFCN
jgi:hypothetical protein